MPAPTMGKPEQPLELSVEERLEQLEALVERAVAAARKHPAGRAVLKILGLQ